MIIEPAIHITMMRLIDRKDCSSMREEHFSYILASSCEDILKEFQDLSSSNQVAVELPYVLNPKERCDVFVDLSSLRFPNAMYQHQIHCECKYFRQGTANQGPTINLNNVWEDFSQVVNSGTGVAYAVILCENEWDKFILRNDASVKCFSAQSPSSFSLYEINSPPKPQDRFQIIGPGVEFKVLRNYTELFELKFGNGTKYFRIYMFRLFSKGINSDDFQFVNLR